MVDNVNIEAVRDHLQERVRHGRTPVEAAGEVRLLNELQASQGVLSNETRNELISVIDEWLADAMDVSADEVAPYSVMSAEYAQFLVERVSIDVKSNPLLMIDAAWAEWRKTRGKA